MRPPKWERERQQRVRAWRGYRVEQYAEAYVRGDIELDEFERLLATVTPENADQWDYRFRGVADPRLISHVER